MADSAPRAPLIFGLDGGGTSVRLRIADGDNRTVLERGGPGVNPNASGLETVGRRLQELFLGAFAELGLDAEAAPKSFAAGCVAAAGTDRPEERSFFEGVLRDGLGFRCPLAFVSDSEAALVGGHGKPEGIILVAGTGSIALARLADGRRIRAGGFGHFLSDEGSAFFIAFQALRRGLRSLEGRDLPTTFMQALLDLYGLASVQDIVPFVYRRFDKAFIASGASLVAEFRDKGDELAADIYREAKTELASLVESVVARSGTDLGCRDTVLWGGLFEHDPWLRENVADELRRNIPGIEIRAALHSAAYGACLLAAERADLDVPLGN